MFGKKSSNESHDNDSSTFLQSATLIGKGVNIEGEVIADGDIRIDGHVKGLVQSKSKVVVGPTGSIDGDVFCDNGDISGKVTGKLECTNTLFLKATANITGDFNMGKLVVDLGARLNGNCTMGVKEMKAIDTKEKVG